MAYCRRCLKPIVTDLDVNDENLMCPKCKEDDDVEQFARDWSQLSKDERLALWSAAIHNIHKSKSFDA